MLSLEKELFKINEAKIKSEVNAVYWLKLSNICKIRIFFSANVALTTEI